MLIGGCYITGWQGWVFWEFGGGDQDCPEISMKIQRLDYKKTQIVQILASTHFKISQCERLLFWWTLDNFSYILASKPTNRIQPFRRITVHQVFRLTQIHWWKRCYDTVTCMSLMANSLSVSDIDLFSAHAKYNKHAYKMTQSSTHTYYQGLPRGKSCLYMCVLYV